MYHCKTCFATDRSGIRKKEFAERKIHIITEAASRITVDSEKEEFFYLLHVCSVACLQKPDNTGGVRCARHFMFKRYHGSTLTSYDGVTTLAARLHTGKQRKTYADRFTRILRNTLLLVGDKDIRTRSFRIANETFIPTYLFTFRPNTETCAQHMARRTSLVTSTDEVF